ncbi:hypothetical protein [Streptomyces violaceus]
MAGRGSRAIGRDEARRLFTRCPPRRPGGRRLPPGRGRRTARSAT